MKMQPGVAGQRTGQQSGLAELEAVADSQHGHPASAAATTSPITGANLDGAAPQVVAVENAPGTTTASPRGSASAYGAHRGFGTGAPYRAGGVDVIEGP